MTVAVTAQFAFSLEAANAVIDYLCAVELAPLLVRNSVPSKLGTTTARRPRLFVERSLLRCSSANPCRASSALQVPARRIGQDKPMFIAAGTVEEKIQELQSCKQELADAILDDSSLAARSVLDTGDLAALLGA
jgi:hypothetical protein